ncbi:dihydropteroate synthase [Polymorphospora sp. NPDC050346]|uniref:dihydropteroate synthase n=1 Tax=Polymorphospora sp. NPDC050346 TaxID=3155780 RepID=UPI0033ED75DF
MPDLLRADHPVVMGVLNVTPDSFSDGGRYTDLDAAVRHGVEMREQGADLVDIGGESTRPGADRVDARTEIARILPVVRALADLGVPMSVDTTRASVADAALEAGATVVNDVSGGLADPAMAGVVAAAGCPWVLMHWRGHSKRMRDLASYSDVVRDVRAELARRIEAALAAGVAADRIVIDPGLGFAKGPQDNWRLTMGLPELLSLGYPLLFAASRKSYLGQLLAGPDGTPRPTGGRTAATVATSVLAVAAGAWGVRVHDVRETVDALAVWRASGRPRLAPAPTAAAADPAPTVDPAPTADPGTGPGQGARSTDVEGGPSR